MIITLPIICILNIFLLYFNEINILRHLLIFEGTYLIILSLKLNEHNIYYHFNKKISIIEEVLKRIRLYIHITAIIYLAAFSLYSFNILPENSMQFFVGALPTLFSGFAIDKFRKSII